MKKLLFILTVIASITTANAQQPTIEQTLKYLNANITDLDIGAWGYDKIAYDEEKNIIEITLRCVRDCEGESYPQILKVNMNRSYEIEYFKDDENLVSVNFKTSSIINTYPSGKKTTRKLFAYSKINPKMHSAMKHLLKLAYANRDTTFDNISFDD